MFSVLLECAEDEKDAVVAGLWELGTQGLQERDLPGGRSEIRAFFESIVSGELLELYPGRWRREDPVDWVQRSQSLWRPLLVGQRFFLVPDWMADETPPGRIRIPIHPGLAFGTGADGTTQLCLEALERAEVSGSTVLDLGTGSGILAIAAKLLGASRVVASDIDPQALPVARENLRAVGLDVPLWLGSVRCVRTGSIDLVIANLNAETIVALAGELRRCARRFILSGFPARSADRIAALFPGRREIRYKDDWGCLMVD